MKDNPINKGKKELLDIITSVISSFDILEKKKDTIPFNDAIKRINSLEFRNEELNLKHFAYLARQLFLGENGKFDFNFEELKKILSLKAVKSIFNSLIESIKLDNFLNFLLQVGEILSVIYFEENNLNELIEEFEHRGINNYEFIFNIFAKCKTNKNIEFFSGGYKIYFSEVYLNEITYRLIIATHSYIQLSISSPNFDFEDIIDEIDDTIGYSKKKNITINDIEKYIVKNLKIFWINSHFFYSVELDDFINIFYELLMQNGSENFILNNKMDENMKIFLKYISFSLENLFII